MFAAAGPHYRPLRTVCIIVLINIIRPPQSSSSLRRQGRKKVPDKKLDDQFEFLNSNIMDTPLSGKCFHCIIFYRSELGQVQSEPFRQPIRGDFSLKAKKSRNIRNYKKGINK